MPIKTTSLRFFTQAARDAAALARQRKRAERLAEHGQPGLVAFVLRAPTGENLFRWEIRRYGSLDPVTMGDDHYRSPEDARSAAKRALHGLKAEAAAGTP